MARHPSEEFIKRPVIVYLTPQVSIMADGKTPLASCGRAQSDKKREVDDLKRFSEDFVLNTPVIEDRVPQPTIRSTRDSGYSNDYSTDLADSDKALGDSVVERLLGLSTFDTSVQSKPVQSVQIPKGFVAEIRRRHIAGELTSELKGYYLKNSPWKDSKQVPGQNGRPSVLQALLAENTAALVKANAEGFGWRPIQHIGTGTYGSIVLWRKFRKGRPPLFVAIKETKVTSFYQDYCCEAHLTRRLNDLGCKNVINVVEWKYLPAKSKRLTSNEVVVVERKHRIAYEYALYGDLVDLSHWYKERQLIFPEAFIWHVFHSIATALCYCSRGTNGPGRRHGWDSIVHGDLKQDNILLTTIDPNQHPFYPCAKLADFGLSWAFNDTVAQVQHYQSAQKYGTYGCMAPEVLDQSPEMVERRRRHPHELHGPHSDVFSLGMAMQQCLTLLKPYSMVWQEMKQEPVDGPSHESLLSFYSSKLQNLLEWCVEIDPRDRPRSYSLYFLTKACMEYHRELLEKDKLFSQALTSSGDVLFTKAMQHRYDSDEAFREEYREANLRPLLNHLEAESYRNMHDGKLRQNSLFQNPFSSKHSVRDSAKRINAEDQASETFGLRAAAAAFWSKVHGRSQKRNHS